MKSLRKMMVRAFQKEGRAFSGSKTNPNILRRHGYKSARSWARIAAGLYFSNDARSELLVDAPEEWANVKITQEMVDDFVNEEINCWRG